MNALIIDDSRATRRIIGEIMGKLGFECAQAGTGVEGLEQLKKMEQPDVVLVDWNMPEMNGLDFIKAVRSVPEYAALPLIMVTTETEMERMAFAFMAGVNEYVMKPFCAETIREKLELIGIEVCV